ncbi:hypothetical protein [Halobellus captivus]|uniref:hypothetical protein n=1 Tax=Halobellus captivus TaxID=2592614 RepID=UPI0011A02382|nr:hypothetical protein [Halobellus captivus]
MSLQSALRDRFRPWYLLDVAAFLFGAGGSIWRTVSGFDELDALTTFTAVTAVVYGLLAVVVLRFTVGNLWSYAVEYANAGGRWSDLPFLVPVGGGLAVVAVTYAVTESLGAAAWAGFWSFAVIAGVVAVAVSLAAGYREASP